MTENYKKYLLMWFKKKRINLNEKTDFNNSQTTFG